MIHLKYFCKKKFWMMKINLKVRNMDFNKLINIINLFNFLLYLLLIYNDTNIMRNLVVIRKF